MRSFLLSDSWRELWELQEHVEQAFRELRRPGAVETTVRPPTEILEDPKAYLLRFDLPGVRPDAVNLQIEAGTLWLSGSYPLASQEGRLLRGERRGGRFATAVPLPRDADAAALTAQLDQGVLTVTVPRRAAPEARRIPVVRKEPA